MLCSTHIHTDAHARTPNIVRNNKNSDNNQNTPTGMLLIVSSRQHHHTCIRLCIFLCFSVLYPLQFCFFFSILTRSWSMAAMLCGKFKDGNVYIPTLQATWHVNTHMAHVYEEYFSCGCVLHSTRHRDLERTKNSLKLKCFGSKCHYWLRVFVVSWNFNVRYYYCTSSSSSYVKCGSGTSPRRRVALLLLY